jgi:hypothetical protein
MRKRRDEVMRKWEKVKSCGLRVTGYEFGRKTSQIDG